MKSEKKVSEAKHYDMISLYKQVQKSAAMNEDSELWKKIAQNYNKDIQVCTNAPAPLPSSKHGPYNIIHNYDSWMKSCIHACTLCACTSGVY